MFLPHHKCIFCSGSLSEATNNRQRVMGRTKHSHGHRVETSQLLSETHWAGFASLAPVYLETYALARTVVLKLPNAYVVVPPSTKLVLLLLHNCSFATVMDHNANICGFRWSRVTPVKAPFDLQASGDPRVENHCSRVRS